MKNIKLSQEIPDIYHKLRDRFGIDWERDGLIICNGDTLHSSKPIYPEKIVHELVHSERQEKMGLDAWWSEYLNSDGFRLEEEKLAYQAEYKFIKRNIKNREAVFHMLNGMAKSLSSHIYGNIISYNDAVSLIKQI